MADATLRDAIVRALSGRPNLSGRFEDMPPVGYDPQYGPANMDQMRQAAAAVSAQRGNFDPLGFLMGAGGGSLAAAPMAPLVRGAYRNVPESLMGFRRNGPQTSFADSNYGHELKVRVDLGNGVVFDDAIKGMNGPHALERAFRNWPDAVSIDPLK